MSLRIEKKAFFYKEEPRFLGQVFFWISMILAFYSLLTSVNPGGSVFGEFGFIFFLLPGGFIGMALGIAIEGMLQTSNTRNYGFKQGRTQIGSIVSKNQITKADNGRRPISICFDAKKRRYFWYYYNKFYSTTEDLTLDDFSTSYSNRMSRKSTHVYLIKQENSNMYKIGITNNVKKRTSSIQTSNPNPLFLEHSGKVSNAKELERKLHSHFKRQKINREWFRLDTPDVDYVIRCINENKV